MNSLSETEAPMSKYVVVANRVNQYATIHLAACAHLGANPLLQTASADRFAFDDGLEALTAVRDAKLKSAVWCGHCLDHFQWIKAK